MKAEVTIIMNCPKGIIGHHQLEDYLKKKLKAEEVTVNKWKSGESR